MALINSASKSSRLLASRRYTHDTFTDAQESFTNVLDLRAEEIYTQAQYIPSSALPFSGSSQHGSIQQASGSNLMKYWYRHKLTPSNVNTETWFFLSPTGSDDGVGAQLINDNQEVNFLSPKYSVSSLANAITEDATPGYGVVLYKSSTYTQTSQTGSLGGGDKISGNDYIFDYKTGVVQFLNSSVDPASNEVVFMSAYQYVGKTLATGLDIAGDISASNMLLTGNLQLGGGSGDTISVTAEYSGSLIPDVDDAFDLGKSSQQWKDLYINGVGYIDSFDAVTSTGVVSGSAVYGTTLGQNTTSGLKTITIEDTSYINQDLTTDANVTFNHITASGNISSSGTIYADNFQSTGGSVEGISFTDDIKITGNMTASGDISGSATSTGSFGHIITSGEISASGRVYVNSEFPQLQISDDGYDDSWNIGISGNTGYLKSSDTNNGFRIRRSDNFDIARFVMSTETTEISGSGGLNVKGNVTSSGTITGSAVYGTTIGQNRTDGVKTITIEANSIINQDLSTDADATLGTLGVGNVTSTGTVSGSAIYGTTIGQNRTDGLKTITIEANSIINQDLSTDADATLGTLAVGNVTSTGIVKSAGVLSGSSDAFFGQYGVSYISASNGSLQATNYISGSEVKAPTGTFGTATISAGTITGITDITVADGGTGASSLTDGGVLLGSGTDAITAMGVLSDGEMIVGDGSTDPVAESGATLRTSIGVGTGDSPQFTGVTATGTITGSAVYGTTIGQNRTDGVKTLTIESNSTVNQDLTTDATPTFDGLTLTGNTLIGTLAANRNLIVHGDLTAQNYIVSSSVTHLTQSFSSGSTIFGDSPDDTHRITGSLFIGTGSLQSVEHITGSGVISGSEVYGTTIGQNRVDGLKTITIESNSIINQDVTTDATPTFDGITSTGTIASSGLISGSGDLWVGDQSNYISGSTGNVKVSGKISASSAGFTDVSASTAEFTSATITGGTISGITDLAVADGGTGASTLNDLITLTTHTTGNYVKKVTVGTGLGGAVDSEGATAALTLDAAQTVITSLLATDIKIGEDNETRIDFGTPNEIHFYAGNQRQFELSDGSFAPTTDSDVDLGSTGVRWKDTYVDSITVTGDITGSAVYGTTLGQNRVDGLKTITIESNSTINQDVTTDATPTFGGLTLTGDLTVQGDTTTLSTTNLQVGDAFIFAATGSAASNVDGGLIVQSGSAVDSGSAIYHDTQDERWAVAKGVASDGTAVTPTAYVSTITTANHNPNTDSGSYGSGEMWVNTTDEEIWVRTG